MKQKIIEECKKYGYELNDQFRESERKEWLSFVNENVYEDLQLFQVLIDHYLEKATMALIVDMSSWECEAIDSNLNNEEDVLENIKSWLNEDNLNSILEWLVD